MTKNFDPRPTCRAEIDKLLASLGVGTLEVGGVHRHVRGKSEKLNMRGLSQLLM